MRSMVLATTMPNHAAVFEPNDSITIRAGALRYRCGDLAYTSKIYVAAISQARRAVCSRPPSPIRLAAAVQMCIRYPLIA
ncbi:MAG: hypothetical protein FJX59_19645 [Alphaproteobacteria bacterium]|nr:hypothetical protein [Alphaproteobacteria bacterium]